MRSILLATAMTIGLSVAGGAKDKPGNTDQAVLRHRKRNVERSPQRRCVGERTLSG